MVTIAILWVFLSVICLGSGILLIKVYERLTGSKYPLPAMDIVMVLGLVAITIITSYWSILGSVGRTFSLVVFGISIASVITYGKEIFRRYFKVDPSYDWKWLLRSGMILYAIRIGSVYCLLYASLKINVYDSGLYHIQAIKWITEYPLIPGLGNLHTRLAFNNHSFLSSAVFSFPYLNGRMHFPVNSWLFALIFLRSIGMITRVLHKGAAPLLAFYGLVLAGSFYFLSIYISSPSPDITVALLILFAIVVYQHYWGKTEGRFIEFIVLVISLVAVTVKTSAIPLILLPLLMYAMNRTEAKSRWMEFGVISLLIFAPFLIRNAVLSGYLLYPLVGLDLFDFAWKIDPEQAVIEVQKIKSWARAAGGDVSPVQDLSLLEWIPSWWESKDLFTRLVLLINLASPLAFLGKKSIAGIKQQQWPIVLVLTLSSYFWLFSAPHIRFAYGILIGNAGLVLALLLRYLPWTRFIVFILFLWFTHLQIGKMPSHLNGPVFRQSILVSPAKTPMTELRTMELRGGLKISIPVNDDRCYDAPLPCTPQTFPGLSLRGDDLKSGFVLMKRTKSQQRYSPDFFEKKCDSVTGIKVCYDPQRCVLTYRASDSIQLDRTFFLHYYPREDVPLTPRQAKIGFINKDFQWTPDMDRPGMPGSWELPIPLYALRRISTGQYDQGGRVWQIDIIIPDK